MQKQRKKQKWTAYLLLCAFLVTNLFAGAPVAAFAETEEAAGDTLTAGTYYVPLTLTPNVSGKDSNYTKNYIMDTNTGVLVVKEDGSRELQFKICAQQDTFNSNGSYYRGSYLVAELKQIIGESEKDMLPKQYTSNAAYTLEPTADVQQQYGFEQVAMVGMSSTSQTMKKRVLTITAEVGDNLAESLTFSEVLYSYYQPSNSKYGTKYESTFQLTMGTPTTEKPAVFSKTVFTQTKAIDSNTKYFQHPSTSEGKATGMATLSFSTDNYTNTTTNDTRYYYSLESAEAITEQSPYVDLTGKKGTIVSLTASLSLGNSAVLDLADEEVQNGWLKNPADVDIKDYVGADGRPSDNLCESLSRRYWLV